MAHIYACCNQKGGVGKTATAQNLSFALAEQGKRVLMVDLDPEYHLTTCSGLKAYQLKTTVYDVIEAAIELAPQPTITDVITPVAERIDLVPANELLSGAEPDLLRTSGGEFMVRTSLDPVRPAYDFILLDCPPNLGLITINALVASDHVILPVQADYLPMRAMQSTLKAISVIQQRTHLNPQLAVAGVLVTMTDHTSISQQILESIREVFKDRINVFNTVIRRRTAIRYAQRENISVLQYEPNGDAATDYRALAQEILSGDH
jgi:chromosome partitioning protein